MLNRPCDVEAIGNMIILRKHNVHENGHKHDKRDTQGAERVKQGGKREDGEANNQIVVEEDLEVMRKAQFQFRSGGRIEAFEVCEFAPRPTTFQHELEAIVQRERRARVQRLGV